MCLLIIVSCLVSTCVNAINFRCHVHVYDKYHVCVCVSFFWILFQSLAKEKELTSAQLLERERLTKKLEEEKKSLEEVTSHLKGDLMVSL